MDEPDDKEVLALRQACRKKCAETKTPIDTREFCEVKIQGKTIKVQVLLIPVCSYKEIYNANKNPDSQSECKNGSDIAVIQSEELMTKTNGKCLPLSVTSKIGDEVVAAGFPQSTYRGRDVNYPRTRRKDPQTDSQGHEKLSFSKGEIIDRPYCLNTETQEKDPMNDRFDLHINQFKKANKVIQTTADSHNSMSGGALVKKNTGEIIGVMAFIGGSHNSQSTECVGSAFAFKVKEIDSLLNMDRKREGHLSSLPKCHAKRVDFKQSYPQATGADKPDKQQGNH